MGYYTNYTITAFDYDGECKREIEVIDYHADAKDSQIVADLERIASFLPTRDSCKWYEHEEDMIKLSQKHPAILFKLHGAGEETGDIWDKWFLNGKKQICKATIVIPDFDAKLLK